MVVGEAVIVAGIGCRKGASAAEVRAAVEAALRAREIAPGALFALATLPIKQGEPGMRAAAEALGLPLLVVDAAGTAPATLTVSPRSLAAAGTPSVSETAALLAAAPGARLIGPRLVLGRVTCALAESGQ